MTNLNPEDFRPKVKGESDFFSWNLYRWLKKNLHFSKIYKRDDSLWIGSKDPDFNNEFSGARLCRVCSRQPLPQIGCYGLSDGSLWVDVNDQFWGEYKRIGVCAIHGDYAHKWNYLYPTKRKCEYCGKIETSHIETIKREVWK